MDDPKPKPLRSSLPQRTMSPSGGFLLGPPFARGADAPPPDAEPLEAAFADDDAFTESLKAAIADVGSEFLEAEDPNPLVDLFHVVAGTPPQRLRHLLSVAWEEDALTALKLICNLRAVRSTTGKGDREGFYIAALWMHNNHPRSLIGNLRELAQFGCLKDFPELLSRLVHGVDARRVAKDRPTCSRRVGDKRARDDNDDVDARRVAKDRPTCSRRVGDKRARDDNDDSTLDDDLAPPAKRSTKPTAVGNMATGKPGADQPAEAVESKPEDMGAADPQPEASKASDPTVPTTTKKAAPRSNKMQKTTELAVLARGKYKADRAYRTLFDEIAQFFADLLASDLKQLQLGDKRANIGLAAKWCPTPGKSFFDRATLLCEAIARRMFPRDSNPSEYAHLPEEHYSYRVLHRLRREVLGPLRKALKLPEVYMSDRRWSELPYDRVGKEAMRRYKHAFQEHDEKRFAAFLDDVEANRAKIAAGAVATNEMAAGEGDHRHLLPHEIASMAMANDGRASGLWRAMVEELRAKGVLRNCIALCDVSEGMRGTPMDVCVALGLLISELSIPPWTGMVLKFSSDSTGLERVAGDNLRQRLEFILGMIQVFD